MLQRLVEQRQHAPSVASGAPCICMRPTILLSLSPAARYWFLPVHTSLMHGGCCCCRRRALALGAAGATSPESRYDVMSGHSPFPGPPRRRVVCVWTAGHRPSSALGRRRLLPCFPARTFPAAPKLLYVRPRPYSNPAGSYITWLSG